jgi:uncharacterized membrane protein
VSASLPPIPADDGRAGDSPASDNPVGDSPAGDGPAPGSPAGDSSTPAGPAAAGHPGARHPAAPHPGARLRATAGLALVGASLALALEQLAGTGSWVPAFVSANVIPAHGRNVLLVAMVAGALLGAVAALALLRFGRDGRRLDRVARLTAPLVLIGLVPGVLAIDPWSDALMLGLTLGAFLLAIEPLWRLHFEAWQGQVAVVPAAVARLLTRARAAVDRWPPAVRRRGPVAVVIAATLFYAGYMAFFTVRSHYKFNTYNWDLGHLDNEFWNDLHGRPFRNTLLFHEGNWANIRNHVQPTIYALLPFYALFPRAESLLVLQAVVIAAGAIPLYRFAARRLPRGLAAVLALSYLLYPPTHGAQFFDFHFQPIAATCILAAIDCLDAGRMRLFWLFFVLAIGCREDVSAGTALFGLALMLGGRRLRVGAAIFAVSVGYFVAFRFFIMPAVGAWGFADLYKQLFPADEPNFVGIVRTMLSNPLFTARTLFTDEKLRYALQILTPLAFLPLRRPYLALSLLPAAFFTFLTTQYLPTVSINYQYSSHFVGYIFPAAALALALLGEGPQGQVRRRAAAATLIVATLMATAQWGAIPPRHTLRSSYGWINFEPPTAEERQRRHDLEELGRMVPLTASLAVSDREVPHLSNRYECWNLAAGYEGADYVLYTTMNAIPPDLAQGAAAERAGYTRLAERPGLILLRRPGAP